MHNWSHFLLFVYLRLVSQKRNVFKSKVVLSDQYSFLQMSIKGTFTFFHVIIINVEVFKLQKKCSKSTIKVSKKQSIQPIHYIPRLVQLSDWNVICYLVKSWSMSIPAFLGKFLKGWGEKQCSVHEWIILLNQIFSMNWIEWITFMNYTEMNLVHCDSVFWSQCLVLSAQCSKDWNTLYNL